MDIKFFGFEPLSLVDFDGKLTCTVFTKACNLRCPFCHNASLVLDQSLKTYSFEEIYDFLSSRRKMLDAVCISGGEPTLMKNIVEAVKKIKELGYLIKLDTNGTNPDVLQELINQNLLDYIAMDIKNSLDAYHTTCGLASLNLLNIQKSINIIQNSNVDYEFRTTLVKEFHNQENIEKISNWIINPKRFYLQKFVDRDTCLQHDLHEIDFETAKSYRKILKEKFSFVELRGY